jgi:uncharacterized membrane protein
MRRKSPSGTNEGLMRVFLAVLGVSTISSVMLWNFGLAHRIWPTHPFFATAVIAALCAIVTQLSLKEDRIRSDRATRK